MIIDTTPAGDLVAIRERVERIKNRVVVTLATGPIGEQAGGIDVQVGRSRTATQRYALVYPDSYILIVRVPDGNATIYRVLGCGRTEEHAYADVDLAYTARTHGYNRHDLTKNNRFTPALDTALVMACQWPGKHITYTIAR